MNKKTLFSCTLWAIFALNSVAFAAEGSRSQLEEVTSDSLPIEITDVTLEGCTGTYDDRTGEYIFGQLEGIKSYSVENEYSVNVGDIDTENRHLDEMKLIESGGEETEFLDFSNKTEIMSIESSLPDLMVYDLVATTDLIVGQTQNRFSYKVANLGSSMAEDVEVTFIVDNRVAGTYNIGDIGASQVVGGYFVLGEISQEGTHGIGVYVDYRNQIEESDETNNFLGKYFTWYDEDNYAPDLTVEITSPTNNTILEGTYADESNKETVEFKIANIGPVDSPDNKFTLYVYADGKPITGMRVSPMSKFTALSGNFKMNVNAYKAFELEMVIDTLNEVKEANENNNSDLKEYNVRYCIHRSNNITEPPFPADDVKVQINTNAFFGYMTQDLYASKLGAWNGITDKVKIKNVVVSSSDNISDETQVYILSDAEAFNLFPYTPAWTEQTGNSNALIVITLNDALMSTRTEEQCARTLIHELGHVFGMDHPNESEDGCEYASILYQSSYDNPTKCSSQVTGHDKYGLYNIYEDLSVQAANLEQGELCSNVLVYLDKLIQVDSEQVLSNNSDYIVKGRILPNKQNIATDFSGYTQTNLIVDDVFKGEGLTQGEIIQIKEPYYTRVLDSGVEKTTYYDGYTPSEEGEEYIFFLNRLGNSNDYVLTFTSFSRYTANDIVVTGIFEENSVGYSEEIYKKLREAVIEKYN